MPPSPSTRFPAVRRRSCRAPAGALLACLLALFVTELAGHPLGAPPGTLVDVNGVRLHLYCKGQGTPAVILDSGLGGASLEWLPVMAQVARFTEVCTYDRAGYGWSDMGQTPRTSTQAVDELYLLLANAGRTGPFLLVGHSYGGYNAQLFARRYAYLSAGLVLVDASHPDQVERFQAPPYSVRTAPSSRHGLVQFGEMPPLHPSLSRRARLQALYQYQGWKPRRTLSSEMLGFRDSAQALRDAQPMPPIPLMVLTRGRRAWPATAHGDRLEQLWIALQSELAAMSPESAHMLVKSAGHSIHLDEPDAVAYGIALVYAAALRQRWQVPETDIAGTLARNLAAGGSQPVWLRDALGVRRADEAPRPALAALANARPDPATGR